MPGKEPLKCLCSPAATVDFLDVVTSAGIDVRRLERRWGIQRGTCANPCASGGKLLMFLRELESGDFKVFLNTGPLFFSRHCAS